MNMLSDGYMVFVDESGDHGLVNVEPTYPVFVLAFVIVRKSDYARHVVPEVTEFKMRHFGHDQFILHEREIRRDLGVFSILRDRAKKQAFLNEFSGLVDKAPIHVVATVIHKEHYVSTYHTPDNPYEVALGFGLERVHGWLKSQGASTSETPVILECRGKREDGELELEFRRICAGKNFRGDTFLMEPIFVPKSANIPGLQLADLIARPIGRHVLDPSQPNRAYDIIETKMVRGSSGKLKGWGLNVFP